MVFRVTYMAGEFEAHYLFADENEWAKWRDETAAIKQKIADINKYVRFPNPRLDSYRNDWLPMVDDYEEGWGRDYVAPDIQAARMEVLMQLTQYD